MNAKQVTMQEMWSLSCNVNVDLKMIPLQVGGFLFTPLSPLRFGAQFPMIQQFIKNLLLPIINSELIASCHASDETFLPDYEIWHAGFWVRLLNAG